MRAVLVSFVLAAAASAASVKIPVWPPEGVPALTARDVVVQLDGESVRVLSMRGPKEDLLLLVILDLTGDLALVEPAKNALIEQAGQLGAKTYVGVIRAHGGLAVLHEPSADREGASEAIRSVPVSGKAGLLETVEQMGHIADAILAKTSVRVAILYVTDSDIQNYREDFSNPVINSSDSHDLSRRFPETLVQEKVTRLGNRLATQQTPLFIVHLKYRSDRLNEAYQNGLKQLAETTGGSSAFCRTLTDIPEQIRAMLAVIESHYSVSVELPKKPRKAVQVHFSLAGSESNSLHYRPRLSLTQQALRKE
jgi:hypothetical protein